MERHNDPFVRPLGARLSNGLRVATAGYGAARYQPDL
jgi:hypothetical protein